MLEHWGPNFLAKINRLGGATVARLTPVQKVACSNHVRVTVNFFQINLAIICYGAMVENFIEINE